MASDDEDRKEEEGEEEKDDHDDDTPSERSDDSDDDGKDDGDDPLLPAGQQKKFEFAHEKKVKKVTQKREKQNRKKVILNTIDNNKPPKLCGGVDVYLVSASKFFSEKGHGGDDEEGGGKKSSHTSSKSYYVRMEISWPRDIYSAVQKSPSEKVDPDCPDTVDWGSSKFKNVAVYCRGGEENKNSWMKYPKLIFTLKSKGKLFNTSISQAEILLGPTVIEPKANENKNDQDMSAPLLTAEGEVRGEITVRIKYQSCASRKKGAQQPAQPPPSTEASS